MFDIPGLGVPELILLLVLALIIFGPGKLPEIGRSFGRAIGEFKEASHGITRNFEAKTHTVEGTSATVVEEKRPDAPAGEKVKEE